MRTLHLPACPICKAKGSLIRQVPDRIVHVQIGYTCWQCGSVLAWLGDDLWLHGDRWAYQRIGHEDKEYLLHRPLTPAELHQLADEASVADPTMETPEAPPGIAEIDITPRGDTGGGGEVIIEAPSPGFPSPTVEPRRPDRRGAQPRPPRDSNPPAGEPEASALVPMAKVLPEGMTLALVRYEGAEFVPVAVFEEGQLRAIPARRRRGRGSPLLLISIGLTLLCLLCSASLVVLSTWLDNGLALMNLPQPFVPVVPTATPTPPPSPAPVDTPVPSDTPRPTASPIPTQTPPPAPTPLPAALLEGVTDYVDGTGRHIIVGEVLNTSGSHLRFVEVMASYYDADGELLSTGSTFAELDTVEPNGRAPFRLATQMLPPSFHTYELRISHSATDQAPLRLRILSHGAFTADTGAYHIAGELQNPYDFGVKFAQVVGTYYDSATQVVRVETMLTDPDLLEPGQISSFEIILVDPPVGLSHYKLQTEAVPQ